MTNLADIAAALREHSPGALPESLTIEDNCGAPGLYAHGVYLHDDIAAAVLRDAMTQSIAPNAVLIRTEDAYRLDTLDGNREKWFHDSDHGGSLGACFQAWRWSKGLPAA